MALVYSPAYDVCVQQVERQFSILMKTCPIVDRQERKACRQNAQLTRLLGLTNCKLQNCTCPQVRVLQLLRTPTPQRRARS